MGHGMSARVTEDSIDTDTPIAGTSKGGQLRILARSGKTAELRALMSTFGGAVTINALRNGDEYGRTALHLAALYGKLDCCKEILKAGMDLDFPAHNGTTALHLAAGNDCTIIIRWLVQNGAKIGAEANDGDTPLHIAALRMKPRALRVLLEMGADPLAKSKRNELPSDKPPKSGDGELIRKMLAAAIAEGPDARAAAAARAGAATDDVAEIAIESADVGADAVADADAYLADPSAFARRGSAGEAGGEEGQKRVSAPGRRLQPAGGAAAAADEDASPRVGVLGSKVIPATAVLL